MKNYSLSSAVLVIGIGFLGFAVGALFGPAGAASAGTGIGSAVGALLAVGYYLATKDSTPSA